MVSRDRIAHDGAELKEVLLGFLESASSLCDMMNTTMAAVLNEIMSIQADEACGADYGSRSEARASSRNGYRRREVAITVGTLDLRIPKLRRTNPSSFTAQTQHAETAPVGVVSAHIRHRLDQLYRKASVSSPNLPHIGVVVLLYRLDFAHKALIGSSEAEFTHVEVRHQVVDV